MLETPIPAARPVHTRRHPELVLGPAYVKHLAAKLREDTDPAAVCSLMLAAEHDRSALSERAWQRHAAELRDGELGELLSEDPLIEHARRKPRGYPGDAGLLDRIYFGLDAGYHHGRPVSPVGRALNAVIVAAPGAEAVRCRRVKLASLVDAEADRRSPLRVASIACGYLREGNLSWALSERRISRWTCLDQDPESTRQLCFGYEHFPEVTPLRASIAKLIAGGVDLGPHDLIYSAGLYDYLDAPVARALTAQLFASLPPGGRLVIGNFAAGMPQRAFMEAFADWWLIYRTRGQLAALLGDVPAHQVADSRIETCTTGCVHYLDVRRVG